MTEPATNSDYVPSTDNVSNLPPAPKLRIVKTLEEAEANVVDVSARVARAIEENKPKPKARKKPAPKKPDPLVAAQTPSTVIEDPPAADIGETILLDRVVETSFPPSLAASAATSVSMGERIGRAWAWGQMLLIALLLLVLGMAAAAYA